MKIVKKFATSLMMLLVSNISFALPCPTNSNIIYKGNTTEEIIKECGQPQSSKNYIKTVITAQKWQYYKNQYNNQTFNQENNNVNVKLTFVFNQNKVVNINIVDSNCKTDSNNNCNPNGNDVASTNICGNLIRVDDTSETVQSICGAPTFAEDLGRKEIKVTEFTYNGSSVLTLIFENNILVDMK